MVGAPIAPPIDPPHTMSELLLKLDVNACIFSAFTQSIACFPVVYEEIKELFNKLQGLQETEKQINSEIVDNVNQIKSHLIRAEDARYYNG